MATATKVPATFPGDWKKLFPLVEACCWALAVELVAGRVELVEVCLVFAIVAGVCADCVTVCVTGARVWVCCTCEDEVPATFEDCVVVVASLDVVDVPEEEVVGAAVLRLEVP